MKKCTSYFLIAVTLSSVLLSLWAFILQAILFRMKNDVILDEDDSSRISWSSDKTRHILSINKSVLEDAGRYSVRVINEAGEMSSSARLVVKGHMQCCCYIPPATGMNTFFSEVRLGGNNSQALYCATLVRSSITIVVRHRPQNIA